MKGKLMIKKREFIDLLAQKGYTKKDAEIITDDFVKTVEEILTSGDSVMFHGFGTFEVKSHKPREGKGLNNEPISIQGYACPKFTAGKQLKRAVREANSAGW